ncbi:MAG: MFS transporter [Sulfolobaceae archaeon]|nr:MFS transporter [Sulfolobaceae archaeon]
MRIFLGQTFLVAGLTMLSLLYPISIYNTTHSTALLGLSITLNNIALGIGSYVWGLVLDKTRERYFFSLLLPMSGLIISFIIFKTSLGIAGYAALGFFTALDSPLYSILLLEQFTQEMVVIGNSRLSQLSLAGNVIGSIIGALFPQFKVAITFFVISLILNATLVPRYKGEIREDKRERIREFKELVEPLLSFSLFNLSAEIFYVMYIPLLTIFGLPSWVYFFSYTILYVLDEYAYYKAPTLVKDNEIYYGFLVIILRSVIVVILGLLVFFRLNISYALISVFQFFGSSYAIYSTSFFSVMFKNLSKNRGAIIGLFNAGENFASAGGSILSSFVSPTSLTQAYFISFFGFSLSFFLFYDFLTKKGKVVSSS